MYGKEFEDYNRVKFKNDIISGILAAFICLPLGLSYGISSHISATAGIISFIVATMFLGLFSSNVFQIYGSAAISITIFAGLVEQYGVSSVYIVGMMIGLILITLAIFKLGKYVELIPDEVIEGLNMSIGVVIIVEELSSLLNGVSLSGSLADKIFGFFANINSINILSLSLLVGLLVFLFLYPKKWESVIPSVVIVFLIMFFVNAKLNGMLKGIGHIDISQISSGFLSSFKAVNIEEIIHLLFTAVTLTVLFIGKAFTGGLSIAKTKNTKLNGNRELLELGVVNLLLPFVGAMAATTSIGPSRVAIKYKQETRISAIIMSITLISILLFFRSYIEIIPEIALSSILIYTGLGMIKIELLKEMIRKPMQNIVMIITVLLVLFFNLAAGVVGGFVFHVILKKFNIFNYNKSLEVKR